MNRRNLLKSLVASTIATASLTTFPSAFATATNASNIKKYPWKNWSGNQSCFPSQKAAPATISELQNIVAQASGEIRCVGAGHSFSSLVPTEGTILSTRRLSGIKSINSSLKQANIYAGTILSEVGPLLNQHDQALINMPDIDQQTLAGAVSTATHGTGKNLGSLSSYITELDMVLANGDTLNCSAFKNTEVFNAAKVGLGALGVITNITFQNTNSFKLKRQAEWLSFEEASESAFDIATNNRNFEFFYFPFTGMCLTDRLNITDEAIQKNEEIDGNSGIMDLKAARDYLSWSSKLRELIIGSYMKTIGSHSNIDHSYAIYSNDRNVRFNEMEYHLPVENGLAALKEIKQLIENNLPEVFFPIEVRFIKGDDAWLSPFHNRDCMSIAIHRYFEEDFRPLFKAAEPIFQKYGGRPHWGKINTLTSQQASKVYPKWRDFLEVRQNLDPTGKFLNPYLRKLFDQPV